MDQDPSWVTYWYQVSITCFGWVISYYPVQTIIFGVIVTGAMVLGFVLRGQPKEASNITLKFCPDHYNVYLKEVIPSMPLKYRILTKIALKIGAIKIEQLKYMQSDQCFYCRFGSGGHDKKNELPPIF